MKISKRLLMVTVISIFTGIAGNAMANGRICSGVLSNGERILTTRMAKIIQMEIIQEDSE